MSYFRRKDIDYFLGDKNFLGPRSVARDDAFYKLMRPKINAYYKNDLNISPVREILGYIFKSWAQSTYLNAWNEYRDEMNSLYHMDEEFIEYISPGLITNARDAALIMADVRGGYKILSDIPTDTFPNLQLDTDRLDYLAECCGNDPDYKIQNIHDVDLVFDAVNEFVTAYMKSSRKFVATPAEKQAVRDNDSIVNLLAAQPHSAVRVRALDWVDCFYASGARKCSAAANESLVRVIEQIVDNNICDNLIWSLKECAYEKAKESPEFSVIKKYDAPNLMLTFAHKISIIPGIAGEEFPITKNEISSIFDSYIEQMGIDASPAVIDYMKDMTARYTYTAVKKLNNNRNLIEKLRPTAQHSSQNNENAILLGSERLRIANMCIDAAEYEDMLEYVKSYEDVKKNIKNDKICDRIRRNFRK